MNQNPEKDYIFGIRAVMEAIHAGRELEVVLVQKNLNNDLIKELLLLLHQNHVPVKRVPDVKLNSITRKNHQGVICFYSPIRYASLEHILDQCYASGEDPFFVILDRITDVRNFGAISRSAECAGVHALIISDKGNAIIGADAVKTSAGALHHIPVCRVAKLAETIQFLKNSGLRIIALTEKSAEILFQSELQGPAALLLGSEEDGISSELLIMADTRLKIPMKGTIGSLNVSATAAIALYEVVRQRGSND
ncbi:MAG: 23S rRNA (guanosine(2251)-2'-O)-methyltransferase RlmB [Cyclobacteriaceae bacterium]|nr:23S rRNA (guanosine(2251)-2'-O)-methyltransferase RlmB [Cyclobacteriaceae bacterium]